MDRLAQADMTAQSARSLAVSSTLTAAPTLTKNILLLGRPPPSMQYSNNMPGFLIQPKSHPRLVAPDTVPPALHFHQASARRKPSRTITTCGMVSLARKKKWPRVEHSLRPCRHRENAKARSPPQCGSSPATQTYANDRRFALEITNTVSARTMCLPARPPGHRAPLVTRPPERCLPLCLT